MREKQIKGMETKKGGVKLFLLQMMDLYLKDVKTKPRNFWPTLRGSRSKKRTLRKFWKPLLSEIVKVGGHTDLGRNRKG